MQVAEQLHFQQSPTLSRVVPKSKEQPGFNCKPQAGLRQDVLDEVGQGRFEKKESVKHLGKGEKVGCFAVEGGDDEQDARLRTPADGFLTAFRG